MSIAEATFSVQTLRSGQPRPYADTEREYLITVTRSDIRGNVKPWLMHGDIEPRIAREEADRAAGRMSGGMSPDNLRKGQREWAKSIVRALCQTFREKDDDDGIEGAAAYFYPTLKTLKLDGSAGTIRAFIIEPYTD